MIGGITFQASPYFPDRQWGLFRDGRLLIIVDPGDPIEDVDYDLIMVSPAEFERLREQLDRASRP